MNQIKGVTLGLFLISSALVGHAEGWRLGIEAGANVSDFSFKQVLTDVDQIPSALAANNRTGFVAGVKLDYRTASGLGADFGLMYSYNDATLHRTTIDELTEDVSERGKNHLMIPVNFKYALDLPMVGSVVKPVVMTGPVASFKLDSRVKEGKTPSKFDFGWSLGAGLDLLENLEVKAAYTWDVNDAVTEISGAEFEKINVRYNQWVLSATVLF